MHKIYLSLGTNLGDRQANLLGAIELIERSVGKSVVASPLYESQAWGFESEHAFLNCCLWLYTKHSPHALLEQIKQIEKHMGRGKTGDSYTDRIIDIDILFYGDLRLNEADLQIPHPRLSERNFVLRPLADIAPDLRHPESGRHISELLEMCKDPIAAQRYNAN